MIAAEKVDLDPAVGDLGQFPQEPGIALRDRSPVFEPEIEKIAHQEDFGGIFLDCIEPGDEKILADPALGPVGDPEMEIGCEEDLSVHKVKVNKLPFCRLIQLSLPFEFGDPLGEVNDMPVAREPGRQSAVDSLVPCHILIH